MQEFSSFRTFCARTGYDGKHSGTNKNYYYCPSDMPIGEEKGQFRKRGFFFIELLVLPGLTKENIIHVESEELNN